MIREPTQIIGQRMKNVKMFIYS